MHRSHLWAQFSFANDEKGMSGGGGGGGGGGFLFGKGRIMLNWSGALYAFCEVARRKIKK